MIQVKKCLNSNCDNQLTSWQIRNKGKYCSKSCSAKINNQYRSEFSKSKQKATLAETLKLKPKIISKEPKVKTLHNLTCIICENNFKSTFKPKTCSSECYKINQSRKRIKFLKENAGTFNWIPNNKPTYFEQSFIDWLDHQEYNYVALKHSIHNPKENTTYFLDFYFPDLNVNIELDGTHHERPDNIKRDEIRDAYLKSIGIDVLRISIRDYNRKNNRINCFNTATEFLSPRKESNLHVSNYAFNTLGE